MTADPQIAACPECKEALRLAVDPATQRGTGFCPRCRGRWTTVDEARAMQRLPPGKLTPPRVAVRIAPCPTCVDQWLVPSAEIRGVGMRPLYCTQCEGVWLPNIAPPAPLESDSRTVVLTTMDAPRETGVDDVENHPLMRAAVAVVIASVAGLMYATGIGRFLIDASLRMAAHEIGHASAALLSGVWAIPLPYFTVNLGGTSVSALIAVTAAIAVMAWYGVRQRLPFWCALSAVLFVLLVRNGYTGDADSRDLFIAAAGFEGEFLVGTLLIIASFHRLWWHPSWDVVKYVYLGIGIVVLVATASFWGLVAEGTEDFPMGSAFGGHMDSNGDLNKLIAAGSSLDEILARATSLRTWCLTIAGGYVAVFGLRGVLKWNRDRRHLAP